MQQAEILSPQVTDLEAIIDGVREGAANGALELPLLPGTALTVFQVAQEPDSCAASLAELIQSDQKMATEVTRVANSAAYSPGTAIHSLIQAMSRLGLSVIAEIAISTAFRSSVFDDDDFLPLMQMHWREALATAVWAKECARARRSNVESAYLAGLLHNIGAPIAVQMVSRWVREHPPIQISSDEMEQASEVLRRELGRAAAESYDLPEVVAACIERAEHYAQAENHREDLATIRLASMLARWMIEPESFPEDTLAMDPVVAELNLYPDQLAQLLALTSKVEREVELRQH